MHILAKKRGDLIGEGGGGLNMIPTLFILMNDGSTTLVVNYLSLAAGRLVQKTQQY